MNEWIVRALCAAAGAATYKIAEAAVKRLRAKRQESPVEKPPVEEAPVEVV